MSSECLDNWKNALAQFAIDLDSSKVGSTWNTVFQPQHTLWHHKTDVYVSKAEALDVLFMKHPSFRTVGIHVMKEYIDWCETIPDNSSYIINTPTKAKSYLEYRIKKAGERWEDDIGTRTSLKEECAMYSFRSAISHLDSVARWQGVLFTTTLIDTEEICILKERLSQEQSRARAEVQDYAATSRFITKRLTSKEKRGLIESWWNGSAGKEEAKSPIGQEWAQMRGLLMYCLQNSIGRRGADLRNIRLSMLFTHYLPNTGPVKCCPVIGASLRHVKESADNMEHLLGWMRSKDRYECPLGALACYMVYMNDIEGPPILNIIRKELLGKAATKQHKDAQVSTRRGDVNKEDTWYNIMLIQGRNGGANSYITMPICYSTHNLTTHAGMDAAGVSGKTTSTHIFRNSLACDLIEKGSGIEDIGLYMGWYHNTAADRYLRGAFKTDTMMVSHGWDNKDSFECWWECDDSEEAEGDNRIPQCILDIVFPGLDRLYSLALEQTSDKSVVEFLKCMKLLRRIFIEDAVVKQSQYPDFPAYKRHCLFHLPEATLLTSWLKFREEELSRISGAPRLFMATKQKYMIDAVKVAVSDLIGSATKQPHHSQNSQGASKSSTSSTASSTIKTILSKPPTEEKIPEIKEPTDMYTCYQDWIENARDYFMRVVRPPWKAQHGDRALSMRLRYCRVKPYFNYIDIHSNGHLVQARILIDKLDTIRQKHNVAASVFIKQCMYSWTHGIPKDAKKPPPILPEALEKAMIVVDLPIYKF